ncbi:MAG TPA: lipopolysaccharide kinase InaA family protein, partial [Gemmatales bacterium]|nr:lipopolysaccharide kinase InaA family protein [Gemmatales bacterium]
MPNLPVASWKQIHCGETSWWVDPAWSDQLLDQHGLRLGEWKKAGHVEVIKKSSHRTILRVCLAESSVVVKHYPIHDFLTRLRSRFITKAEREYQRTVQLQEQAVATIRPVAFGQHPQDGSYFISEEITNAQSLEQLLLNHHFHDQHWDPSLKQVFKELAHFLAEMLQHGIIHKDLHAGNILIRTDDQGEREWYLIDPYCVQTSPPSDRAALIYMLSLMGQSL